MLDILIWSNGLQRWNWNYGLYLHPIPCNTSIMLNTTNLVEIYQELVQELKMSLTGRAKLTQQWYHPISKP